MIMKSISFGMFLSPVHQHQYLVSVDRELQNKKLGRACSTLVKSNI